MSFFKGKEIICSIKMDGENTNMYSDYIHARSIDSKYHSSRTWVKNFYFKIRHKIPEGWRICGENMYAKHSIHYRHLKSYFLLFSIWDKDNICLSWDETFKWAQLNNIELVNVI
jgi:hypothetical protein